MGSYYPHALCQFEDEARKRWRRTSAFRVGLVAADWKVDVDPAEFPSERWGRLYEDGKAAGAELRRERMKRTKAAVEERLQERSA